MGGSYQDQERLVRALEKFETFDARAEAQPRPEVMAKAAGAFLDLLARARVCGYSGDEYGLADWSAARVATFLRQSGREHEDLSGFANIEESGRPFPVGDGTFGIYARLPHDLAAQPRRGILAYVNWVGVVDPGAPVYWNETAKSYNSTCGLLMPGWQVERASFTDERYCVVAVP